MKRHGVLGLMALILAALALVAAGCGGDDEEAGGTTAGETTGGSTSGVQALPSSSCTKVEYKGEGEADVLIASDLPMQGASRTQTTQIVGGIRYVLEQRNWKAGDKNVAYQVCDDATAQAGKWDSGKCSQNAKAYGANEDLVGVVGTFNSGCAAIEIPDLNRAPGGGVAMVSPANTFVCLTTSAPKPVCQESEPDKYYPTGERNYVRLVAHDAYQGAAVAQFAKDLGVKSVFVLNDKEAYGQGVATNFRGAAESLGLKIAGFAAWDPKASSYEALMRRIKGTGADAIFLGGLIDENGGQVIKDKVSVLGPNSGAVKLLAPDGFTTSATLDPKEGGATEGEGMYSSVAGLPADKLTGLGKTFITEFKKTLGGKPIDPYSAYGAQSAEVLLSAIEKSDGSRSGVIDALFQTDLKGSYLGDVKLNEEGDPAAGPISIYVARGGEFTAPKVITPAKKLVDVASGR